MPTPFGDDRDWFLHKRFGLFIHWGLYAIPAWHEQQQWRASVPRATYEKLRAQFNPVRFDPDAWLDMAERAGMEYLCITTKHHDGFCLWDTATTDYNVMRTPYGRDILALLAEACQRRGFPLCLYYSVVDWHHPAYPNQRRSHELPAPEPGDAPDWGRYRDFLVAQVRELCTRYGEIHGFWWDMNVTGIVDPSINDLIRSLQPAAVINNRGFDAGDFGTPERDYDDLREMLAFERLTEACQSVGRESWGYRVDEDYYTDRHLMASVDGALAKGGNYLLNVGPMADGTLPPEAVGILERLGGWFQAIKESFYGCEPASARLNNREVLLTRRGYTLYVHLHRLPTMRRVLLDPIIVAPTRATLLNTGEPVAWSLDDLPTLHMSAGGLLIPEEHHYLRLKDLPVNELAGVVPVVRLEFERDPFSQ
jgi:alpha-L-fucosidase